MTLTYSEIMVRYGELSTKGKNRMRFINKLRNNIKDVLSIYPEVKVTFDRDRGHIYLNGTDYEPVAESLKQIFGIQAFSPVYKFEKDVEVLKKAVQDIMTELYRDGLTFKVTANRSDHDFVLDSRELNLTLGNAVFDVLPDIKAQMKGPDVNLKVEIRAEAAYISHEEIKGAGGLPVGTAGKGMLMLSGGIDSPVAGYLALKRGVDIECVHFAAPPYTNEFAREKVFDLVDQLRHYTHGQITVHVVNFTKLQLAVYDHCDESYAMTVMRRMMYRIGEKLARKNHCLALVNGESMNVINEVISIPVLRPVLCLDKLEIIDIAQKINTYDISIRPHEDCCTIFTPKAPATKPKSYKAVAFEETFDFDTLVDECVETVETIVVDNSYKNDEDIF